MKKSFILLVSIFFCHVSSLSAASQYETIDREIFALQKSFVSDTARTLQIDSMSGTRQTGSMILSTRIDTASASGSISLTLDPYSMTVDGKSGNSDMQYRGRVVYDIRSSDYRYDTSKDEYREIPIRVTGHINFEVSLIQADGHVYMRLSSIDGVLTGDAETQKSFDRMILQAEEYKDKTYRIPGSSTSSFQPEDFYEIIQWGFSTLMSSPLFTVVSKNKDGSYRLRLDPATLKKLGIISRPSTKETITYKNTAWKKEIRISPKLLPKMNYIILSESLGKRSLTWRTYTRSRYSTSDMSFSVSRDAFSLMAKSDASHLKMDGLSLYADHSLVIWWLWVSRYYGKGKI
jgi:hypothetical protein